LKKQFYIGAYALVMLPNQSFVFFRKLKGQYYGLYDLPGGGAELGENPEDVEHTIKRELFEELGVDTSECDIEYLGHKVVSFANLIHSGYIYVVKLTKMFELSKLDRKGQGEILLIQKNR
jgi:8-oxo-dGTP pyrophosphatase MutT (NUDIX family)